MSSPSSSSRAVRIPARSGAVERAAWALALWFGCGRVPRMPGTAGTLGALPIYLLVRNAGPGAIAATAGILAAVGVWASGRVARALQSHDPQVVCIDEVAGVLVAWTAAPPTARGITAGFLLFRLFDWIKPPPARALERLPGGFGIVLDDLAAGGWTAALLLAARAGGWL